MAVGTTWKAASEVLAGCPRPGELESFVEATVGVGPGEPMVWQSEVTGIESLLGRDPGVKSVLAWCRYLPYRLALELSLEGDVADTTLARIRSLLSANSLVKERGVARTKGGAKIRWVYCF